MLSVLLYLAPLVLLSTADLTPDQEYDSLFKEMMKCNPNTAAFAISAVKDGEVVFNNVYGKASRENDIAATIDTRFSIGSISKEFTGYMAGKQVLEGHYRWSDKINDAFAKYNVKMSLQGNFRNKAATLEDALTHHTGIKQYEWLLTDDRPITRAKWITEYVAHFQERVEMRSVFYYNNWFYDLIGYLIELAGGKSFEEQVKETVFEPLGMTQTCFVSDPEFEELSEEEFSQPYKEGSDKTTLYPIPKRALKYIGLHNPAGGIVSTSGDMAKYMIAVIDALNGTTGTTLLNTAVLNSVTVPKVVMGMQLGDNTFIEKPTFPETFKDSGYAYGHIIGTYKGYKYVNHGGSTYGHYSYITVIPSLRIGVFTVISGADYKNNWRMQKLMQIYMIDSMMGDKPWLDATTACTFPQPWIDLEAESAPRPRMAEKTVVEQAELYVGNYTNVVYPRMELKLEDSVLKFEMGNSNGTVVPVEGSLDRRMAVILNMAIDPLNLPDSDKQRAYLIFTLDTLSDSTERVLRLHFEMGGEQFKFERSSAIPCSLVSLILFPGILLMTFFF